MDFSGWNAALVGTSGHKGLTAQRLASQLVVIVPDNIATP